MPRRLIFLHVLLSITIVFNGIAGAEASTRTLMGHAGWMHGSTQEDAADQASQPQPCHVGMTSSEGETGLALIAETPAETKHSSNCCKSGACRCECVHQSQVGIAAEVFIEPAVVHSTSVRAMKPARAAPPLPHLIRPPIG